MKRLAAFLVAGAAAGKLLGFVREILLAHALGVSVTADSFRAAVVAILLPLAFFQGDIVTIVMIPLFNRWRQTEDVYTRFTLLTIALCGLSVGITVVVELTAPNWVLLIVGGFSETGVRITTDFVRIMALAMPATVVFNCLAAIEIASGRARLTSIRASIQNIGIIIGILTFMATGSSYGIPVGFTLAINLTTVFGVRALTAAAQLRLSGGSFRLAWDSAKQFVQGFRVMLIQPCADWGQVWIEKSLASSLQGTVAALDYARTLTDCTVYLIGQPIGMAVLAGSASRPRLLLIARALLAFAMPASVVLLLMASDLTRVVLERGAFQQQAVALTSHSLSGIAVGATWSGMVGYVLLRQLYGEGRIRLAVTIFTCSYVVNILFNIIVGARLGAFGFGLGESVRGICLLICTVVSLTYTKPIALAVVASLPACAVLSLICYGIEQMEVSPAMKMVLGGMSLTVAIMANLRFQLAREWRLTHLWTVGELQALSGRYLQRKSWR